MRAGVQSLGQLIKWLESQPKDRIVRYGFGKGHSDRGDYSNVAFDPVEETTIGRMLEHANNVLNTTQTGYKGGEYEMYEYVDTHIGYCDECGEPITSFNYMFWGDQNIYPHKKEDR